MEAGSVITAKQAERRVLMLENPGIAGGCLVSDSLYAGLQLVLPGEIARTHRHSASALRFIIEGRGAYTSVEGERAYMAPLEYRSEKPAAPLFAYPYDRSRETLEWISHNDPLDECHGFKMQYINPATGGYLQTINRRDR